VARLGPDASHDSLFRRGKRTALALLAVFLTAVLPLAADGADRFAGKLLFPDFQPGPTGAPGRNVSALFRLTAGGAGAEPGGLADETHRTSRIIPLWEGWGSNALAAFSGSKAWFHLSAVAGTVLIIETGLDTQVHNFFARHTFFQSFSHFGVRQGAVFPPVLGGVLLVSGLVADSSRLASAGGAVLQASLLGVCTSTLLKALTGRPGPSPVVYGDDQASRTFLFGFLRGGVFHGWPSGHMLSNTAAVTSLLTFYHHSTWLKVAGGAYIGYLFLSVISHGRSSMHWFSDAVAGVLMGYAIGSTVGRDFRKRWEGREDEPSSPSFSLFPPVLSVSFSFRP
jgi:hypothetical protein